MDVNNINSKLAIKNHNVVNGIVPVEIENVNDIMMRFEMDDTIDYGFKVVYKFLFENQNNPQNYQHNVWSSTHFTVDCITDTNEFYFKVPSFLSSYTFQYKLILNILQFEKENNDQIQQTYDISATVVSDVHSVEIPSILIESTYKINDLVQYTPENSGYCRTGTILELLDHNKIKIQTHTGYDLKGQSSIVIVDISKVLRNCIFGGYIVDVTNNINAVKDLILRTNDDMIMDIFDVLNNYLEDFYFDEMYYVEDRDWNFQFIASTMTAYVCEYLCECNHNYRVYCVFEDGQSLFMRQVWKYDILKTYDEIKDGKNTLDLQCFQGTGYTCDICRCESSRYQFMYHCNSQHSHDFCISCIYSLILQNNEMNQFIGHCLDDLLNEDCIDQIVTFCVGKVTKIHYMK